MQHISKNKDYSPLFFILFTIVAGIIILSNYLDYQPWLSQGDHGLNLYAAQATLNGERPYHDYHWFYGPFMPKYYAFFFKIFGTNIQSVLLGKILLEFVSGLLIYFTLSVFFSPFLSSISAIWFWIFSKDFFYTYNHVGGVPFLILLVYLLFVYVKNFQIKYLYPGLIGILFLSLIKLNIGLSALGSYVISIALINYLHYKSFKYPPGIKYFYISSCIVLPLILCIIHWTMLLGLPFYIIKQCFQYFGNDAVSGHYPPLTENLAALWHVITSHIEEKALIKFDLFSSVGFVKRPFSNLANTVYWTGVILSSLFLIYQIFKKKLENKNEKRIISIIALLVIFYILQLHEFLISGIYFRCFWSESFSVILIFAVIGFATHNLPKFVKYFFYAIFFAIAFYQFGYNEAISDHYRNPRHYLSVDKAKVYLSNSPEWIMTVQKTTKFLNDNLEEDEQFFALPYDPLYYFLTDKSSPNRQLVFFEFLDIPKEQQKEIIADLENKKINWIVLSNRSSSEEHGIGVLGKTHGVLIADYINSHFAIETRFGDWNKGESTWIWNHGVQILKRIP